VTAEGRASVSLYQRFARIRFPDPRQLTADARSNYTSCGPAARPAAGHHGTRRVDARTGQAARKAGQAAVRQGGAWCRGCGHTGPPPQSDPDGGLAS
jgi:hypothetical protein